TPEENPLLDFHCIPDALELLPRPPMVSLGRRILAPKCPVLPNGRTGRICGRDVEPLKCLRFSNAAFDFVYSPCVVVSRRQRRPPIPVYKFAPCPRFTLEGSVRDNPSGSGRTPRHWSPALRKPSR